jgi:para-aminobenzoate synthetase / 4-amino-4-deoxychorismate lyase
VDPRLVSARFDDLTSDTSWVFAAPEQVLVAHTAAEVPGLLRQVDTVTTAGAWAWGYVGYEAAPAFDSALQVRDAGSTGTPMACFAIGSAPVISSAIAPAEAGTGRAVGIGCIPAAWRPDTVRDDHSDQVGRVRAQIAAGRAYQVNLTTRLRGATGDTPLAFYARIAHAQRGAYNAYLELGEQIIACASPELFFRWDDAGLTARPMKGTARRGESNAADESARTALLASAKQRAENVMIVDLLRNDLSRVARLGSVRVTSLLTAERYETVWQLTSTVIAAPAPDIGLPEVFAALFPCGSVTGAPKVAAMEVIAALETSPRGVYCGAIGMVGPPRAPFRARFAVPIRTAVIDRATGHAVYGSGGAITWESDAGEEYDELLVKAAVLDEPARTWQLLETLRATPGSAPAGRLRNLERHLTRMLDSARYFDIPVDLEAIRAAVLDAVAALHPAGSYRVRVLLDRTGRLGVDHRTLTPDDRLLTLAVDDRHTTTSRWTRHKTTHRSLYEDAAARHPHVDDVILVDASGHALETTRANLAVRVDGTWCTPPLARGCLPGVERSRLIDEGRLQERDIRVTDLDAGTEIAVVSSLRGWRAARLGAPGRDDPPESSPPVPE